MQPSTVRVHRGNARLKLPCGCISVWINDLEREQTIGTGPSAVTVRIYAGVAKSNPESAGWYLYCNGREILSADHSAITGWGEGADKVIPKFHNQYAMFRGYTYLESRDGRQLPWNTTKTGVEVESPLYRAVRQNMIALMRPIIDYLNKLDIEKTNPDATIRPLQEAFESAKPVSLAEIETQTPFVYPEQTPEGMPRQRITYSKPLKEFDRVRKSLKATTAK